MATAFSGCQWASPMNISDIDATGATDFNDFPHYPLYGMTVNPDVPSYVPFVNVTDIDPVTFDDGTGTPIGFWPAGMDFGTWMNSLWIPKIYKLTTDIGNTTFNVYTNILQGLGEPPNHTQLMRNPLLADNQTIGLTSGADSAAFTTDCGAIPSNVNVNMATGSLYYTGDDQFYPAFEFNIIQGAFSASTVFTGTETAVGNFRFFGIDMNLYGTGGPFNCELKTDTAW